MDNHNSFFLAIAAILVSLWMYNQNVQLQQQLNTCKSEFEGFKQGVIYSR